MLNSRKIEDLKPYVAYLCRRLIDECKEIGIDLLVTGTLRDQEQQDVYYKQGTGSKLLGPHGYGLAFDVVPLTGGKPDWGNKTKWQKVGDLGKSLGLEWGGDWKKRVDCPHFQYVGGLTDTQIRAGMLPKFPPVPAAATTPAKSQYPLCWEGIITENDIKMYSLQDMNKLNDRVFKQGDKLTIIDKTKDGLWFKTEVGWINAGKVNITRKLKG